MVGCHVRRRRRRVMAPCPSMIQQSSDRYIARTLCFPSSSKYCQSRPTTAVYLVAVIPTARLPCVLSFPLSDPSLLDEHEQASCTGVRAPFCFECDRPTRRDAIITPRHQGVCRKIIKFQSRVDVYSSSRVEEDSTGIKHTYIGLGMLLPLYARWKLDFELNSAYSRYRWLLLIRGNRKQRGLLTIKGGTICVHKHTGCVGGPQTRQPSESLW